MQVEEGPGEGANYYRNLKHYTPICYSGRGVPFFLVNHNYYTSLPCIVCVNLVLLLGIVLAFVNAKNSNKSELERTMAKLYLLVLVLLDLSYFLTIAMNPGIVSERDMPPPPEEGELRYCKACNRRKFEMSHCNDCEVCVQDLDHHCGFFGRCIAGKQRFAFYAFILFMFCGFVVIFVGLASLLN